MNKKTALILGIVLSFTLSSFSSKLDTKVSEEECYVEGAVFAVTLKYINKDSKDYEFKVKSCGSTTKVEFDKSKTSTVTIQTGCSDAVIFDKCGEVKVKQGDKVIIKDGCIKVE